MKPIEKSILEYFEEYAVQCPDKRFLFDENRCYTVGDAYREAVAVGNRLAACGVREGSAVALRCTRSLDTCLIYLALQMMGAVALLTDPHRSGSGFLKDVGAQAEFLITNEGAGQDISANGGWEVPGHGPLEISYPAGEEKRVFRRRRTSTRPPRWYSPPAPRERARASCSPSTIWLTISGISLSPAAIGRTTSPPSFCPSTMSSAWPSFSWG